MMSTNMLPVRAERGMIRPGVGSDPVVMGPVVPGAVVPGAGAVAVLIVDYPSVRSGASVPGWFVFASY